MFNPRQQEILLKGINPQRISQRKGGGGRALSYLEAWDVKAHLIRVFGFGGFSSDVLTAVLMFEDQVGSNWNVGYKVILRLTVGDATYTEAAVGSANLPQRGEAHDMAVKTAESRVAAAQSRLDDTVIRAPFAGRVGLRRVSLGGLVTPGTVITTLDDLSVIKLEFTVPQSFLGELSSALPVEARAEGLGDRVFRGKIT